MDVENASVGPLDWVAIALVVAGTLNWALVGVGILLERDLNVVALALEGSPTVEALAYLLVGLAGVYLVYLAYRLQTS